MTTATTASVVKVRVKLLNKQDDLKSLRQWQSKLLMLIFSTQKFARQTKTTTRSDRSFPRLPFFYFQFVNFYVFCILCRFVFDSDLWDWNNPIKKTNTLPKTNMDTQNDGLEKVTPFKIWPCLVSMLVFGGVPVPKNNMIYEVISISLLNSQTLHIALAARSVLLGAWYRTKRKREPGKTLRRALARHFSSSLAQFEKKQNSTNLTQMLHAWIIYLHWVSGQISLPQLHFEVRSCEVAIIWPDWVKNSNIQGEIWNVVKYSLHGAFGPQIIAPYFHIISTCRTGDPTFSISITLTSNTSMSSGQIIIFHQPRFPWNI